MRPSDERRERRVEAFPADPTAARAARTFVRRVLEGEPTDLVTTVELLVSELVTNAVLHARSAPTVEVDIVPGCVRVAVRDADPARPEPQDPGPTTVGGRGLLIIDRLADRWGVEVVDDGKVVWFELQR